MTEYEENLRWRLEVLKTELESGKIHIASHLADDFERSLRAIRYAADGTIDLNTVDGRIRSMALMAGVVHNRNQAKKSISLNDISNIYFEFLDKNFKFITDAAHSSGLDPLRFAHVVSESQTSVDDLNREIPKLMETLQGFWEDVADASHYHIQDMDTKKAVYGGDLFPSFGSNLISTVGLYTDTVVLSDPFWQSKHIFDRGSANQKVFYLIKHALNIAKYKEMATADLNVPIVTFSPFRSSVDDGEREFLEKISIIDGLLHASTLFGREFADRDELWKFTEHLDTPEKLVSALADPSRLLFDTACSEPIEQQIQRALESDWMALTGDAHVGRMVAGQCFGRMGQATDILAKSRYLSGVPLMDAPTSWQYFNWKLEYNSETDPVDSTHLHMVKGLQHAAQSDEPWLGNIPPESLIEMRKTGAFAEIRAVLGGGIDELANANPDGFFRTSDKIVDNIRDAFERHMKEVGDLRRKKIKFAGYDLGTMIVAGGIDIASIIVGTPTFGAASFAVNQIVDAPKLREIPERFRTLKNAHVELKKSPMGLFFRHKG